MKKIIMLIFTLAVIVSVSGCEPPEKEAEFTTTATTTVQTTTAVSETTTDRIGGFIIEEVAPGGDIEWEDIGSDG